MTALRKARTIFISRVFQVSKKQKKFNAVCGLCGQFSLSPSSDIGRWSMRDLEGEQALFLDPVSNRLSIDFFDPYTWPTKDDWCLLALLEERQSVHPLDSVQ